MSLVLLQVNWEQAKIIFSFHIYMSLLRWLVSYLHFIAFVSPLLCQIMYFLILNRISPWLVRCMWRFGVRSWLHLQGFQWAFRHIFQTIAVFFFTGGWHSSKKTSTTYSRLEGLQICGQSLTATGRSRQDTSTVAGFQIQDVESMSV